MKELIKNLFDTSSERIKSPLIGSYITAFIIFNWRPILVLFLSDATIECKINQINQSYSNEEIFLYPLLISIFYVLILPWINIGIDWLLASANKKKISKANDSKIQLLTQKKNEALLERQIAEALAGTSQTNELQAQVDRLNEENKKLFEQNKSNFERFNSSLEIAKATELNARSNQENLYKKYTDLLLEYDKVANPNLENLNPEAKTMLHEMDYWLRNYFFQFTEWKILKIRKTGSTRQKSTDDLIDLKLIKLIEKDEYQITALGKTLYEYLKTAKLY